MTTISSTTILRSRNAAAPDKVLSTLLLRYPRCIHAEFMTHRMLSKNSASSRAIPVAKLIQSIKDDPFVPLHWGKNQKGMQAFEECSELVGPWKLSREDAWLDAMEAATGMAHHFDQAGYHKQIVNRLIEPWMHITVLASGMDIGAWSNFLALRDHPDAEPHIAMLAREVRKCLEREDDIQELPPGGWHMPFVEADDHEAICSHLGIEGIGPAECDEINRLAIKLSVARCASTSYKTVDGFDMTLDRAVALHDKLVASTPLHASPCEHVAQADEPYKVRVIQSMADPVIKKDNGDRSFTILNEFARTENKWLHPEQHGNFVGFRQYRKQLPNECL